MINFTKRRKEVFGLLLIVFAIVSLISLLGHDFTEQPFGLSHDKKISNPLGIIGVWISDVHFFILGYISIIFPFIFSIIGYVLFVNKDIQKYKKSIIYILIIGIYMSLLMGYIYKLSGNAVFSNYLMGYIGHSLYIYVLHHLGIWGTPIFLLISLIVLLTGLFEISIYDLFNKVYFGIKAVLLLIKKIFITIKDKVTSFIKNRKEVTNIKIQDFTENKEKEDLEDDQKEIEQIIESSPHKEEEDIEENHIEIKEVENSDNSLNLEIEDEQEIEEGDLNKDQKKNSKYFQYKLPILEYLNEPIEIIEHNEEELREKGKQLKYALTTFGVDGEVVKVSPGPVISLFEVEPAEGVRVNKFVNLSDDLARVMKAKRIRIIAPIPGSRSVGIELPNEKISIVYLRSILNSQKYISNESKLTIALGKTTSGDAYIFDLCKMPHLLVAGATGSGKSVCINTIIISILYKAKPDEVKFILMDPKKLELSTYKSLVGYHLITAPNLDEYVMTTAENSVAILDSAISEMERRFQVFSDVRVRNIAEYHSKQKDDETMEKVPYIVVLIDELADLMMTSGKAIEDPITRLAQKARAVGIHLVLATQRPSVDVITGLIKSNFPSRISFQVSSKVDSRTILDQMGAEKLLGKGDMLFLLPGSASPIRLHNAFVELDEIEKIMNHISSQPKPDEIKLPEVVKKQKENEFNLDGNQDELLRDAAELVINHQQASVSLLQRKFRIGYSRAGRLIDELESLGIVSDYSGSKARDVLVDYSYLKEVFGDAE